MLSSSSLSSHDESEDQEEAELFNSELQRLRNPSNNTRTFNGANASVLSPDRSSSLDSFASAGVSRTEVPLSRPDSFSARDASGKSLQGSFTDLANAKSNGDGRMCYASGIDQSVASTSNANR